jgi:hypothetical protein
MWKMEGFFHSAVLKLENSPPRNALPGSFSMRVSRTESIDVKSPAVSRRRKEGEIHDVFYIIAMFLFGGYGMLSKALP